MEQEEKQQQRGSDTSGGETSTQTPQNPLVTQGSNSKWLDVQQKVLVPIRATMNFRTLRDMYGEVVLDPGRLKFVSLLGEGNYGTVSKYEYTDLDKKKTYVALKRLKPGVVSAQDMLDFMREVKILKKLRHSRIANFRGTGYLPPEEEGGEEDAFLAQDLVEGGSLRTLLEKQMKSPKEKLYTLGDAITWLLDVARGLKYLHQAEPQVIHRDLKLENIMLTLDREARLVDFGLHKVIDKWDREGAGEEAMFDMTGGTGALMYMPPEAMLGTKYNHKVDVYSFSIIAWELLHHEMLIARICKSSNAQRDLRNYAKYVAHEAYRPPISATLPGPVAELISDCWQEDPMKRPEFADLVPRLMKIKEEVKTMEAEAPPPPERQRSGSSWLSGISATRNKKETKKDKGERKTCFWCF
ncbi:hypothetical protein BSKO_00342 [Bryopsis sp. KO-2023]|nr:hypothetical protein BSKO_00342 [Bryopsis sp. KO-2023]